jgi:hypothetical protein
MHFGAALADSILQTVEPLSNGHLDVWFRAQSGHADYTDQQLMAAATMQKSTL